MKCDDERPFRRFLLAQEVVRKICFSLQREGPDKVTSKEVVPHNYAAGQFFGRQLAMGGRRRMAGE